MGLDIGIVVSLVVAIAGVAVSYGAMRSKSASQDERIGELKATFNETMRELRESRDKLGERVGNLEKETAVVRAVREEEISRTYRTKGGGE